MHPPAKNLLPLVVAFLFIINIMSIRLLSAATPIYRSVGPGKTTPLAGGSGNPLILSGTTATFSLALPGNVGVGDVIQYDANDDGNPDSLAFIHGRVSATEFTVRNYTGLAVPAPTAAPDQDWEIFRAYTSLADAAACSENAGILSGLRNFDVQPGCQNISVASGNNQIWNLACYADAADNTPVTLTGWTTDTGNYIRIFTPVLPTEAGASQRHNGRWDSAAYRLEIADSDALALQVNHVRLEGLQARIVSVANNDDDVIYVHPPGSNADVRIDCGVFRGVTATPYDWHSGVGLYDAGSGTLRVWNCVFYDFRGNATAEAMEIFDGEFNIFASNNTMARCDIGLWQGQGNVTAMNNIAQNCNDGFLGTFYALSDYNLSDLPADAPGANSKNSAAVSFTDAAAGDFHLSPADTAAKDSGTDLSADGDLAFSDDIDGQTRDWAWDIGADEEMTLLTPTVTATVTVGPTPTATPTPALEAEDRITVYPQPAVRPNLYLALTLSSSARVRVEIYNLAGERVCTWEETVPAAGSHQAALDIRSLAPGIYFYRVVFSRESGTKTTAWKKLAVIKK